MPDLLLTHGYFLEEDEKELKSPYPYPPLGLLYILAYLEKQGFGVELYDSTLGKRSELTARLRREPGVVGLYTNLMTRPSVISLIREAKASGWTVVLGGPESANYPEEYLRQGADVIVIGEGELTLAELLPALASRGAHRLHGVAGTAFRDEAGSVVRNPPREQIPDLDGLPWPARDRIDQARYIDIWRTSHGRGSVNLITARGCPYKCNWCSHAVFGYTHRRRSPRGCAEEVQHIVDRYKPEQLWYADDVFTIHHRWLYEYAEELERRTLRLPFETISRADRMMKEEVLETLARMGCYRIWIGSESGSQKILDAMERGVKAEEVQWATRAAQRHGIEVGMFLMWGYEGETLEDIEQTVEHVKKSNPNVFLTTVAYPIKNTGYFEKVSGQVRLDRDWAGASDRDYVIPSQKPREYYRLADQWLRNAVAGREAAALEARRALEGWPSP